MAVKTKKPKKTKKPVKVELQPPNKVGKRGSTNATLLVKRKIRCNGHIHEIGLTSKGQLWIPSHTIDELERYIMMGDLGNNPCKCAVVLDAWRNDRMTDPQLHDHFRRERMTRDRLANRILRHLNKKRNWPDIDVIYGKLLEPYEEEISEHGYKHTVSWDKGRLLAGFVAETVYLTLLHRGWRPELFDEFEKHDSCIQIKEPGPQPNGHYQFTTILNLHHGYNAEHVTPYIAGDIMNESIIRVGDNPETMPWRMLVDATEAKLIYHVLHKAKHDRLEKQQTEFEKLTEQYVVDKLGEMPKHGEISIQKDRGTVTLKIEHAGLTIQAANRLVNHYRETQGRVKRLLKVNLGRRKRWFRVPGKPSRGFGPLVRKTETDPGVETRPVEGENYGIGIT